MNLADRMIRWGDRIERRAERVRNGGIDPLPELMFASFGAGVLAGLCVAALLRWLA